MKLNTIRGDDTLTIRKTTGANWEAVTPLADLHQFATTLETLESGAPLFAEAASGSVKVESQPADKDTLTIGGIEYTFKTTLTSSPAAVPYEIKIGVSTTVTAQNIVAAIKKATGGGSTYSTGTEANPFVTAPTADTVTNTVTVTALVPGVAGNDIPLATSVPTKLEITDMTGGIDARLARKGQIILSTPAIGDPVILVCVQDTHITLAETDQNADEYWASIAMTAIPAEN